MSDKTCGNCRHWHHMKNDCGACIESYSGALSQEVTITGRSESCLIVPNSWAPKTTDTLELRYQQLAELAREMIAEYQDCAHALSLCRGRNYIREYYTLPGDFRKRLEELGVEV